MTQQAPLYRLPWIKFNTMTRRGRLLQHLYEIWLVTSGRYSLWHAWDQGSTKARAEEYQRTYVRGGR